MNRELAFKPGTPILVEDTAQFFKRTTFNVFNTRLFNFAVYRIDSLRSDSAGNTSGVVVVSVHERWYTFPSPIFELADRNFNEWWYDRNADLRRVNLGIRFLQKNVRGLNEDLTVTIQGGFTRRFDISYSIPYLDQRQTWGLKLSAGVANNKDVAYRSVNNRLMYKRDEDSFGRERWSTSLELSKRKSIYDYHFFEAGYSFNRISNFIYELNPRYFSDSAAYQRSFGIRYTFISDHRNLRNFPTKGYYLSVFGSRNGISPYDNIRIWSLRVSYSKFIPISRVIFLATKADLEASSPSNQPYLGTRSLGYENRFVRGYERFVMEGPVNIHTRNSVRWKAISTHFHLHWFPIRQFQFIPIDIYITGFGDAGIVKNPNVFPENERLVNNLLVGYGLGINLVTFYDVVFRTEFSRNIHGDQGIYFSFLTDI